MRSTTRAGRSTCASKSMIGPFWCRKRWSLIPSRPRNRQRDKVKLLHWERNGFVVWYKRLERERFTVAKAPGMRHRQPFCNRP
ncbi:IS66 family insertion sequence element accessory protein TnpB [Kushneria aurantia]|uniref:IS66 family insertion sequence element accessory protein TnpB n=1 Tax=Kushneria aurantia TaxID=504092 RepID=A0ABV6G3S4_9GAMM